MKNSSQSCVVGAPVTLKKGGKPAGNRIRIKLEESDGKTGFSDVRSCTHCNA
jgi:hypothetical protein